MFKTIDAIWVIRKAACCLSWVPVLRAKRAELFAQLCPVGTAGAAEVTRAFNPSSGEVEEVRKA